MELDVHETPTQTTFRFVGPVDGRIAPEVEAQARSHLHYGAKIDFDMSRVTDVTASGMRWVRLLYRQAAAAGGHVTVVGMPQPARDVLDAVGFLRPIVVVDDDAVVTDEPLSDQRIDLVPTHFHDGYRLRPGQVYPYGAWPVSGGVSFSLCSRHATACTLVLFERGSRTPEVEIPFPEEFRFGHVFAMTVLDLDPERFEYGYRVEGPNDPKAGHRFDKNVILLDPWARVVGGQAVWAQPLDPKDPYPRRAQIPAEDFEWEGDRPLVLPFEDLIIYEMHVRGFTRDPSSRSRFPGTYAALREKIPYLKRLGVNCVELLPVFEFNELEHSRKHPQTGQDLLNYWGYSTLGFFAPKAGFAATGARGFQVDEFKSLVKELHRNGIEVMLDVVFNHTAEGNEQGPNISFRGLDNRTFYMLTPEGHYYNFSGCGNTFNCNNPIVRDFVLSCLRYWVTEYHVDGFRFDLASILGRAPNGAPLANPPLLESLAYDPVLGTTKLVAEAWDAGGLYQVGTFPAYGRWAEWNGKYRDCARKFLKGSEGQVSEFSRRLLGSPTMYAGRGPTASINFITCHDGFTLADLVSYNHKHNEANGEDNRDGANDNESWNCGIEGPTDDPKVLALRRRQMKNALTMLLVSQGVPMLLMGDEVGHSQGGNNNAYCQDNPISWMDWTLVQKNADLYRFTCLMIALRKAHPALRFPRHAGEVAPDGSFLEASWHGTNAWKADWSPGSRTIGLMLRRYGGEGPEDVVYVVFNGYWESLSFGLPKTPNGKRWRVAANTAMESPKDVYEVGKEVELKEQGYVILTGRSAMVLVANS